MADPVRPADIDALIATFEAAGCAELHVRFEGFELHLSNDPNAQSGSTVVAPPSAAAPSPSIPPAPAVVTQAEDLSAFEIVRAPYLGTFYRSPKPGEPAFVELGAAVDAETDLCLVEVMKLFTAVRAGVDGTVARILVTDGEMVQADQPLFAIARAG